jgi:anaerobic selenocysteine-containing dehydrogenase
MSGLAIISLHGHPALFAFAQSADGKGVPTVEKWMATTCQGCTSWCPVQVLVINGRAVKVRGNEYSGGVHGKACVRAHLGIQQVYDPDRIKVPMKRFNPKKGRDEDPMFVPITWDEAMNTIADKMIELRKSGKPEGFALFRGRYTYMRDLIYGALPKIFGSPNGISHSAICAEAEKFGPYYTEGYWGYRDYGSRSLGLQ